MAKWLNGLSFGCSKNHGLHRLNRWSLSSTWWFQAAITQIPCSTLRRCWQTSWQNDTRKLRSLSPVIGVIIWTSLIWTDERRKKNLLNLCNLWYWRTYESWTRLSLTVICKTYSKFWNIARAACRPNGQDLPPRCSNKYTLFRYFDPVFAIYLSLLSPIYHLICHFVLILLTVC